MSQRFPTAVALACALALGGVLGSGIAFLTLRSDRVPSDAQIGPRVEEILRGKDALVRVKELSALLSRLDATAAKSLGEAFAAARADGGDPEVVVLALWWARFDPLAALAWTTSDGRARTGTAIAAIFRTWAHSDPVKSLGTARGLAYHLHNEVAVDAAVEGWDESGKPGLLEFLAQFPDRDLQRLCEGLARRRVVAMGPAEALRWVESLGARPRLQQVIGERVASSAAELAEGAPLAAAWATPRVRSDDRLSNFPRRIGTRWVVHDPKAAMAWLATLPAGADRFDGVAESYRDWLSYDREAAFAWTEATEPAPWNEPALALYARAISDERPKEAIELAQRISNPALSEATMIVIGQRWFQKDRAAALAWLAQPGVPERVRAVSSSDDPAHRVRERAKLMPPTGAAPN